MQLTGLPDTIDLSFDETELPDNGRQEPRGASAGIAIGFAEAPRLDPRRVVLPPEPAPAKRSAWPGSLGSVLLHLLPLLALVSWPRLPLDKPETIPIQLVIEQPPPPPPAPEPPKPRENKPPPPNRLLASDDFGKVIEKPVEALKGSDTEPATHGEQPLPVQAEAPAPKPEPPAPPAPAATPAPEPPTARPEPPVQSAAAAPPTPEPPAAAPTPPVQSAMISPLLEPPIQSAPAAVPTPEPPAKPAPPTPKSEPPQPAPAAMQPPRKTAPPKQQMAAVRLPKPEGLILPLPLRPEEPHTASASARYPGPEANRDEYCAYALHLILGHFDLLPSSVVGARRGDTTMTIRLREDGSIMNVMVEQGSGYSDIDDRIALMVKAVGKFPPLPIWLPGPWADFTLKLHFPHA